MITENTLRLKLETTGDGQLKASMDGAATSVQGTDEALQGLNATAAETAQAQQQAADAIAATGESADEAAARIKAMVASSLERADAERAAQQAAQRTTTANAAQAESIAGVVAAQNRAMAGATQMVRNDALAANAAKNTQAIEAQRIELASLVGQIDPTVSALGKLDEQQAKLAAFHQQGLLSGDDFKAYSAAIDASRARITLAGEAMHSFNLNTANTRREVGRLAGDIVNGNWGRFQQTALTLANYSGLMGEAFTATGAALVGVVGILGLALVAYQKGAAEEEAFNKQLLLTGNIAGTTSGQLADMARNIAAATGTTQHQTADTLAQVVATGKFTHDQLQTVATAAQQLQDATGQSVKETIKQFESLANDPAAGIAKLNDQQHFLTLAIYDQIKALQDQGQQQQAVDLAMQTYAGTISDRTPKITENLGLIEQAWRGIKSAAEAAADAAMSVGRTPTGQEKFDALASEKDRLQGLQAQGVQFDPNSGRDLQSSIDSIVAQMAAMQDARKAMDVQTSQAAADQAAQDAGIALARQADQYASAEVKRAREIEKAHGDANAAIAKAQLAQDADLRAKLIAQAKANEEAIVAGIQSRDKKPPKPKADPFNHLDQLVQTAQVADANFGLPNGQTEQVKQILAIVDAGAKLIASGQDVTRVQALVASGVDAVNDKYAKQAAQLQQQNVIAIQKYQDALDKENAALQRNIDAQVLHVGMGDKEYQRTMQLNDVYQKNAEALAQLAVERAKLVADGKSTAAIDGEMAARQADLLVKVALLKHGYDELDAAQQDWQQGAVHALQNVHDNGLDLAKGMSDAVTGAFNDMTSAVVNFASTGKFSLASFAQDFVNAVIKMEAQALEAQAASALMSWMGVGQSYGAEGTNTFNSQGFVSHVGGYADGGPIHGPGTGTSDSVLIRASKGEYMQTADAHAYYGTAFMDAVRTKRLPRFAAGGPISGSYGGAGGQPAPQIIVNNNSSANVQASSEQQMDGSWITRMVIDAVATDVARGGQAAKAMQQRFGLQRRGVPVGG